jgi:DNA-binding PucR family transcriptional regulator
MLGASGCTKEDVAAAIFVLEPLLEHDVKIDKDLLELLALFCEPVPLKELRQWGAELNRSKFRIVDDDRP